MNYIFSCAISIGRERDINAITVDPFGLFQTLENDSHGTETHPNPFLNQA
jgi:hypothetical protein